MAKKRMPVVVIVVLLIISFSVIMRWIDKRDREANRARIVASNRTDALRGAPEHKIPEQEQQINDCDAWAGMSFKEKTRNYRLDPERWARCLCEGEGCELDRLYLTGRVSR
ncbi:MAG: hypothetical protein ABSC55_28230 [Syntrophorhabdales bacterium]